MKSRITATKTVQMTVASVLCMGFISLSGLVVSQEFSNEAVESKQVTNLASLNAGNMIDADELYFLLPDDADHSNFKRQLKAISKGLYWTTSNTVKPMASDLRKLVTQYYN